MRRKKEDGTRTISEEEEEKEEGGSQDKRRQTNLQNFSCDFPGQSIDGSSREGRAKSMQLLVALNEFASVFRGPARHHEATNISSTE